MSKSQYELDREAADEYAMFIGGIDNIELRDENKYLGFLAGIEHERARLHAEIYRLRKQVGDSRIYAQDRDDLLDEALKLRYALGLWLTSERSEEYDHALNICSQFDKWLSAQDFDASIKP